MSRAEFTGFLSTFLEAMLPHVTDGGVVDLCMDWRYLRELFAAVDANGLSVLNMCCWNKTNGGMGSLYRSKHEIVLIAKRVPPRTSTTSSAASMVAIAPTCGTMPA